MAHGTADDVAQSWVSGLQRSTAKIQAGVEAVKVAPGVAAARQKAVYAANVAARVDKWARKVQAVSLQDWQNATIQKGLTRIGTGASAAQPKFAAAMSQLLPYIDNARSQLPARGDLQANINRAVQFIQKMSQYTSTAR